MPNREDIPRLVGTVIAKSPKLVLKIGLRYLRAKKKAQRAEAIFRGRLEAAGMDPQEVERLAEMYSSTVSLRQLMRQMGVPGKVLNGKKE